MVDELFGQERRASSPKTAPTPATSRPSSRICTRMRRTGKPISRRTPTVSRRSSTSMIAEREQKHRRRDDRDDGDRQMKALEHAKRPGRSCGLPRGKREHARQARVHIARELLRIVRIDERDVDRRRRTRRRPGRRLVESSRADPAGAIEPRVGLVRGETDPASARRCRRCGTLARVFPRHRSRDESTLPTLSPSDSASWRETRTSGGAWSLCRRRRAGKSHSPRTRYESNEGPRPHERLRASIRAHSSSVTGMTDSLDMRTSGNDEKLLSALISASVTGRLSVLSGTTSTTESLPDESFGIGVGVARRFRDRDRPPSPCRCGSRRCGRRDGSRAGASGREDS